MEMDYNISDLEKLLNIHNEHEFIIIYTERAKELLEILLEHYSNYTETIVFLQKELQTFNEWENDFYKDQNKNITYISLDSYEHEDNNTVEENFKNLISYLQMFHTGSKILFKFYNNLKQIDVTYDIQTYVNTLEEKYKNMFYNIHKMGPISKQPELSEPKSDDSIQQEFDKLSKRPENIENDKDNEDSNNKKTDEDEIDDFTETLPLNTDEIIISNNGVEVQNIGDLLKDKNSTYSISIGENKEKSNDNRSDDNKSDDNKSDNNQSDDNKSNDNKSTDNKSDDNQSDDNQSNDKSEDDTDNQIIIGEDDKLFNLCNNVIQNMNEIKDTYMTLQENKNSIGICREALEKILSYGLNVESAINQLDTQEDKINSIINNYNNIFQNINNDIDKNSQNMKNDLNGVQFKQQIKKINIQ